jgi:hypothetical protein
MLSDKYLWPVTKLTPVHEAYKLASFQEPVTSGVYSDPVFRSYRVVEGVYGRFLQCYYAYVVLD